jgi:hypothetical protein
MTYIYHLYTFIDFIVGENLYIRLVFLNTKRLYGIVARKGSFLLPYSVFSNFNQINMETSRAGRNFVHSS